MAPFRFPLSAFRLLPSVFRILLSALLLLAGPAQLQGQQPGKQPDGTVMATPWVGAPGIVETTAEIMAREKATQTLPPRPPTKHPLHRVPGRQHLPQNPASPQVPTWPPQDIPKVDRTREQVFRPQPLAAQTAGLSFDAFDSSSSAGPFPPDTMGAVGPTQFVLAINSRIKSFGKSTGVADGNLDVALSTFFDSVRNAVGITDPRIRYDRLSGRWFVTAINIAIPNRVLIAVSNGSNITSSSAWTFFFFQQEQVSPSGDSTCLLDYPTLGIDANAMYIGGNDFCGATLSFGGTALFVVRKSSVTGGGPIVVSVFRNLTGAPTSPGPFTPQGVDNYDPNATEELHHRRRQCPVRISGAAASQQPG